MYLELLKSETTSRAKPEVVLLGLAADGGPEKSLNWAGSNLGGLLGTGGPAAELPAWLIEPGLHHLLPLLVEVSVGDLIVMLDHLSRA